MRGVYSDCLIFWNSSLRGMFRGEGVSSLHCSPSSGILLAWLSLEHPAPARLEPDPRETAPRPVHVRTGRDLAASLPGHVLLPLALGTCSWGVSSLLCGSELVLSSLCTGSLAS